MVDIVYRRIDIMREMEIFKADLGDGNVLAIYDEDMKVKTNLRNNELQKLVYKLKKYSDKHNLGLFDDILED